MGSLFLFHINRDFLRHDHRVEGLVASVAQLQLQGVFAWGQRQLGFSLRFAEMQVMVVSRDHLAWRNGLVYIDQQVVMARVWSRIASRFEVDAFNAEFYGEGFIYSGAIRRGDNRHFCALRRGSGSQGQNRSAHQHRSQRNTRQ